MANQETVQSLAKRLDQQAEAMMGLILRIKELEEGVLLVMQRQSQQIAVVNAQTIAVNQVVEELEKHRKIAQWEVMPMHIPSLSPGCDHPI